jgi:peptide/nickel transport system permease protein
MAAFLIKRLLFMILTVFGVMLITFLLFNCIGGDISYEYAGRNADKETIEKIRAELGLDKPLFLSADSQFANHIRKAVTFNFGLSRDRENIGKKIWQGAKLSLALTIPILLGTLVLSVCLGLVFAYRNKSALSRVGDFLCIAGMSIPFLSFILLGQFLPAYKWGLFPVYFWPDMAPHQYLALPVIIGIAAGAGSNIRFYKNIFLNEFKSEYVRFAFACGAGPAKVLFKHILKNAMMPIVTRLLFSIPFLFLGSVLLERFFGIPGLGNLVIEAIGSRDYRLLNAALYLSAILVAVFTFVADIFYAALDPRISLDRGN